MTVQTHFTGLPCRKCYVNISENIHPNTKQFHNQGTSRWIPSLSRMYNIQHIFFEVRPFSQ